MTSKRAWIVFIDGKTFDSFALACACAFRSVRVLKRTVPKIPKRIWTSFNTILMMNCWKFNLNISSFIGWLVGVQFARLKIIMNGYMVSYYIFYVVHTRYCCELFANMHTHTLERSCSSGHATMTGTQHITSNFQRHVQIKLGILLCCIWKIPIYLMTIFKTHFIFDNFICVQCTLVQCASACYTHKHTQMIICMRKFHGYSISFRNVCHWEGERESEFVFGLWSLCKIK